MEFTGTNPEFTGTNPEFTGTNLEFIGTNMEFTGTYWKVFFSAITLCSGKVRPYGLLDEVVYIGNLKLSESFNERFQLKSGALE